MTIAKILKCNEIISKEIHVSDDSLSQLANNSSTGDIELEVTSIIGNLENVTQIAFINENLLAGTLSRVDKINENHYNIVICFHQGFIGGIEHHLNYYLESNYGLIGISDEDLNNIHKIENQKLFLQKLINYLLPEKADKIFSITILSNLIYQYEGENIEQSYFMGGGGSPKKLLEPITNKQDKEFLHIATINKEDFPTLSDSDSLKEFISFYIRVNDTDNGWPESKDDFLIINYNQSSDDSSALFSNEKRTNFKYFTYVDIPGWGNFETEWLGLNELQKNKYLALENIYKNLIINDYEFQEYNRIMGYSRPVQNCVAFEAHRIKNNLEFSKITPKNAMEWMMLLEIHPDAKDFNFFKDFGDGSIYFMIKKNDFQAANFEDVQVVVQNT